MHTDTTVTTGLGRGGSARLASTLVASTIATLRWAGDAYGEDICLLASMQDAVLVDLAMTAIPGIEVVFLDTGYHFPETHLTRRAVESRYGIAVSVVGPPDAAPAAVAPGACCDSKPALLDQALDGRRAWLTGARRCETPERAALAVVSTDRRGLAKISPLAHWSDADVRCYIETNRIIVNPLIAQGYDSIGCAPCTTRPDPGDSRSGRWRGSDRTECGLHL